MVQVTLGKTGITVGKNSFGALPIQRISTEEAVRLLRKAYENGVTFYDTARFYTDSEEKLGEAFDGMREKIYIATRQPRRRQKTFGRICILPSPIFARIISIFISFTILRAVQNPAMEPSCMRQCWRPGKKE